MASIEEVRAGILAANEHASTALGATQQALSELESAIGTLMHATDGSGQSDVINMLALLAQAQSNLEEARQQIPAAMSEAEGVANRL